MRIRGPRCFNDWDTFTPNGPGSVNGIYQLRVPDLPNAGDEDRFYVSSFIMSSDDQADNYYLNIGTHVGTVTGISLLGDETSFTIGDTTGTSFPKLDSGRQYYIFVARYTSGGTEKGVFSYLGDNEIVYIPHYENRVFPANHTKSYNPATDDFFDCFSMELSDWSTGIDITKGSDSDGDYWRISGVEGTSTVQSWSGLDFIAPEYPFTIEYSLKHNAPDSDDTAYEKNWCAGFRSGCQYTCSFNYYRPHHAFDGETGEADFFNNGTTNWDTADPYYYDPWSTAFTPQPKIYHVGIQATIQHTGIGQADPSPKTAYLVHAHPINHPDTALRDWVVGEVNTLRWEYTGASPSDGREAYTFYGYLNDVLISTLGDTDKPVFTRRRHYHGEHLKFPICLQMFQEQVGGYPSGVNLDIYDVTISSECPYAFAGWIPYSGEYGRDNKMLFKVDDKAGNVFYGVDPAATNVDTTSVNAIWPQTYGRATTQMTPGYTKAHSNWVGNGEAYPIWLAAENWTNANNGNVTFHMQPTTIPNEHTLHSVKFVGNANYGTVQGRLTDDSATPLTDWSANLASGHNHYSATVNSSASIVRPEFYVNVTGFTSTPIQMQQDTFAEKTPTAEGALMYFVPTVVDRSRVGDQLTLTAWGGSTIWYDIDGVGYEEYIGSITLLDSYVYIDYYATDGVATSATVRYTVDRNAPVTIPSLPSGVYRQTETITLSAVDDEDPNPTIKYRWRIE